MRCRSSCSATTSFDATDEDVSDFKLNSIRLYIGGSVMENINFTFNTEYNQVDDLIVLDANPIDDITNTRRISSVYLRGEEVDRSGLREAWTGK